MITKIRTSVPTMCLSVVAMVVCYCLAYSFGINGHFVAMAVVLILAFACGVLFWISRDAAALAELAQQDQPPDPQERN